MIARVIQDHDDDEDTSWYVEVTGGVGVVLAEPSLHGWIVGLVEGRPVVVASATTVQPGSEPTAAVRNAAMAAARAAAGV